MHPPCKCTLIFISIFFSFIGFPITSAAPSPSDIHGLLSFKMAIKRSSIPQASCLATWNFSGDPCAVPRTTVFTCGVTCSAGRIVQLTLDSQGYSGELTPSISEISQLVALDISNNNFHGPIPSSISLLPNLKTVILTGNSFSGSIPTSIATIKSLDSLDLSHNSLTGNIPEIESLDGLTRLDLSYNNLTGPIPKLPLNLQELAFKSNSLSGPLLKSTFDGITQLMVIELSDNNLTGKVDPWIFNLPSLQQLNLARNSFNSIAVAPPPPNSNTQLVAVDLGYNKIDGLLPENLSEYPMMRSLSLSYNFFRGPIPRQYGKKTTPFERLYLDGNYLNGLPPEEFFSGTVFSGSFEDNCLSKCPLSSELCSKPQKPVKFCQRAYGGKHKY